jgi:anaerobic dimethyl sulfoxide reductase subunit A
MVAIVSGQFGKPGTNTGAAYTSYTGPVAEWFAGVPAGDNPVTTAIPSLYRIEAMERGEEMTALHDGVMGKNKLDVGVKFVLMDNTNCMINNNPNLNSAHDILIDESKCEFIVCVDIYMTTSAKYSDLVLPDTVMAEKTMRIQSLCTTGVFEGVIFGQQVQKPPFECRDAYEVYTEIADKLGIKDAYTESKTWEDWQYDIYEQACKGRDDLPTPEEGFEMGLWKQELPVAQPGLMNFRNDPASDPLNTPSAKIEIYSTELQQIVETWKLDDSRDIISPIPIYNPGVESYEDVTDEYPLVLSTWHGKQRYNSCFVNTDVVEQASRQQVWINPVDAEPRGITNGDMTRLFNMRGETHIEARVTPRIIPGVVAAPFGTWLDADMFGDRIDKGGNINILTSSHGSPLSKACPSNSSIVQIEKL